MSFTSFGLAAPILAALKDKGYTQPTPIQRKSIAPIIEGRDIVACAQTGTGKTAAFCIPILQRLSERRAPGVRALILTPTRELAIQISEHLDLYGKNLRIRSAVIFGGVSQHHQVKQLRQGVSVLVATPGRLLDLINQKLIQLNTLEILVLDEADRMLDMGFIHDIKRIFKVIPEKRQNILFSATMPKEVQGIVDAITKSPVKVDVVSQTTPAKIFQGVYYVSKESKRALLKHIIAEGSMENVLVFTRTKHGADRVARDLSRAGITAEAIHGNKSQNARQRALTNFKNNTTRVLVATDIAARGIDIVNLPFVINFELPDTPETYTHRIGRTGRAGATGTAFSLCDQAEKSQLKDINKIIATPLKVMEHPFA
jgi:ATP-dependent RNA helicase RhlE